MKPADKKIERLIEVAQLYYEENLTQNEIAKRLGISRPLVSILLSEARATGVVTITINHVENAQQLAEQRLEAAFRIRRAVVVPDGGSADETDNAVAAEAYRLCFASGAQWKHIGVGWGSLLGRMADYAETLEPAPPSDGSIFPLIGGIGASYRSYHTNELTRVLSTRAGLSADYLYMPAFFDSDSELDFARHMETFTALNDKWTHMDLAIVSISNYPSYPDLGVEYRFGSRLTKEKAVGRVLAYYFDVDGRIIEANVDNVLQVTREQLQNTANCVAMCSALLRPQSVAGALRAGFADTLILPQSLALQVLDLNQ
jgi:deoxyribonucleoside regulator